MKVMGPRPDIGGGLYIYDTTYVDVKSFCHSHDKIPGTQVRVLELDDYLKISDFGISLCSILHGVTWILNLYLACFSCTRHRSRPMTPW